MTYNSQVGNYTYPTNRIRPHAVTQAGTNTYIYDANGNMTSGAGRTIAYNYDNMPKSISKSGITTTSVYDYNGQRIKKTVSSVTTVYIGKLYECTSGVCTKYVFAGSQRIATKKQGVVYYYHTDHLGSSSIITNSAGSKAEEIYYYPYGGTMIDSGSISVKHKYTSQELDGETGLYNYGARYYDPILGRFISADTIVPLPFHPQTLNRYAYAYNNPIVLQDLNGHEPSPYWSTWDWLYGYNNSQPSNYVEINTTQYNNNITMVDSSSLWNFSWNQSTVETYQVTPSNAVGNGGNNSVSGNSSIFNSQVNNSSSGYGWDSNRISNSFERSSSVDTVRPIQNSNAEVSSWYLRSTGELHGGIDIAGIPKGTPIYNMYSGVVEYSGWANGYGNMVSIHNTEGPYQGLNMRYAHMNAPSPLTVSSTVSAGEFIGTVGNSGTRATHLHIDAGYGIFTPRAERINLNPLFLELYP